MYPNIISKILFNSIQIEPTKHLLLEPWKIQIDTKCNIDLSLVLKPWRLALSLKLAYLMYIMIAHVLL